MAMRDSIELEKPAKRTGFRVFLRRLVREKPLGTLGGVVTILLLLVGIFANVLAPYGENELIPDARLLPPSSEHWFGTDNLGRDILSRVIYGARISVIVGLSVSFLTTLFATFIGVITGYVGGALDLIVQRVVDAFMCFPGILLLLLILSITGPGIVQIIIVLSALWGITHSRIIRSAVIGIKENVYVSAAESIGCSTTRVLYRHIVPNIMAPAIVLMSTRVPLAIINEASLSFLGFGIPPPTPSWGGMLSGQGRMYMIEAPWMAFWPGLALAVVVFGVNMFGDAVRDLLDPRLRGGAGSYRQPTKKLN